MLNSALQPQQSSTLTSTSIKVHTAQEWCYSRDRRKTQQTTMKLRPNWTLAMFVLRKQPGGFSVSHFMNAHIL